MSDNPNLRTIRHEDDADSFASNCYEMFSGALGAELGVTNAIIIRKLEIINDDNHDVIAKKFPSCIPDNDTGRVLRNYVWKPLGSRLSKELYYFNTVSLLAHLRQLCRERYLFCKNINGINWFSVNFSKLNRLYDLSKYTK